jgi:hypothetical protein
MSPQAFFPSWPALPIATLATRRDQISPMPTSRTPGLCPEQLVGLLFLYLGDNGSEIQRHVVTHMRLHPSVTKIEAHAFHSCRLLATAASCEGLEIIGESAFFLCTHLKQLVLPRTKNLTYPKRCICIELMDLKLPEYRGVFAGCKSLTNVRISPGVRIMEDHVFNGCSSLFSVELSEGIERIGIYAFSQCMQLKHAFIPSTVIQFGDHVFRWCNKLEELFPAHTKEQLLDALRNRFNGLPIDKLCYFQSSKDSET